MTFVTGTLISDGTSDRALIRILEWLLGQCGVSSSRVEPFDSAILPNPPKGLADKIRMAVDLHECDVLFVHRDAEARPVEDRIEEIRQAIPPGMATPHVCVIPVRMTEAWLLLDETAIRKASGNPRGTSTLRIPPSRQWESIPDPKTTLHTALREASELHGRRRIRFRASESAALVADFVATFEPLRQLPAFRHLETDLRAWWRNRNRHPAT